jgi:hypothetical protein
LSQHTLPPLGMHPLPHGELPTGHANALDDVAVVAALVPQAPITNAASIPLHPGDTRRIDAIDGTLAGNRSLRARMDPLVCTGSGRSAIHTPGHARRLRVGVAGRLSSSRLRHGLAARNDR